MQTEGKFSEKSDVFSFGVLVLQIVSGRRNNSFVNNEWSLKKKSPSLYGMHSSTESINLGYAFTRDL
jgi:hypothetical protein